MSENKSLTVLASSADQRDLTRERELGLVDLCSLIRLCESLSVCVV